MSEKTRLRCRPRGNRRARLRCAFPRFGSIELASPRHNPFKQQRRHGHGPMQRKNRRRVQPLETRGYTVKRPQSICATRCSRQAQTGHARVRWSNWVPQVRREHPLFLIFHIESLGDPRKHATRTLLVDGSDVGIIRCISSGVRGRSRLTEFRTSAARCSEQTYRDDWRPGSPH